MIAGLVANLIRVRLLLTSLRPPMTVTDPLAHVIRELTAADAGTIPGIAALTDELHAISDGLAAHNSAVPPARGRDSRARLADRMRHVARTAEGPLTVDTRLDAEVVLPAAVVREAETAAAALTRLTPHPYGLPAWQSYYAAFMERYGLGAVVPLVEIINPGTGLGFPATFRGSARTLPEPPLSARDERLIAIACETVMGGHDEIALDDSVISHLAGEGALKQVPPHAELFIQLHAASSAAVRRGEFRLLVTGASRAAGATVGRFLYLLCPDDRDRFTQTYTGLAAIREGALAAQVSCPPVHARSESVARAPAMLPDIISVAEYPGTDSRVIPLDDLAVSGDADGLYLVSLARGRPVEPTVFNAVEFRHFTHPIARFLCEITRARAAVYMPFSWGAASSLPFLPRLRHRRSVLALARWNLPAASLLGNNGGWPAWKDRMTAWRQRFRLPAAVYLGEADNLLRLDLDQDVHLALLRAHLGRHPSATLFEAPNPSVFGWLDGRAHEIALPLTSTMPTVKSAPPAGSARARVIQRDHGQMPGCSPWLFAKLYGHPDHQTELLCQVPNLLAGWETPPEWWYIRYRDPEAHLRLRVRLPDPGGYGHAVHLVGAWANRLRSHGLAGRMQLDTYHPETGRYGTGAAMAAAESVFAADSAAAIAQITHTAPGSPPTEAITAASLVRIAAAFTGGTADGMRWLASHIPRGTGAAPRSRLAHAETVRVTSPSGCDEALHTSPGGEQIRAAWCRRDRALAAYRDALLVTGQADLRDSALASLLHMHHIRAAGIDPGGEQVCHRLARSAALGWLARAGELPR